MSAPRGFPTIAGSHLLYLVYSIDGDPFFSTAKRPSIPGLRSLLSPPRNSTSSSRDLTAIARPHRHSLLLSVWRRRFNSLFYSCGSGDTKSAPRGPLPLHFLSSYESPLSDTNDHQRHLRSPVFRSRYASLTLPAFDHMSDLTRQRARGAENPSPIFHSSRTPKSGPPHTASMLSPVSTSHSAFIRAINR